MNFYADIIWYHDGKILKQTSNVRIKIKEDKTSVTIKNAQLDDIGTYACKATSRIGVAETKAKLTVKSIAFAYVYLMMYHPLLVYLFKFVFFYL